MNFISEIYKNDEKMSIKINEFRNNFKEKHDEMINDFYKNNEEQLFCILCNYLSKIIDFYSDEINSEGFKEKYELMLENSIKMMEGERVDFDERCDDKVYLFYLALYNSDNKKDSIKLCDEYKSRIVDYPKKEKFLEESIFIVNCRYVMKKGMIFFSKINDLLKGEITKVSDFYDEKKIEIYENEKNEELKKIIKSSCDIIDSVFKAIVPDKKDNNIKEKKHHETTECKKEIASETVVVTTINHNDKVKELIEKYRTTKI